jgi:hypothetical protein
MRSLVNIPSGELEEINRADELYRDAGSSGNTRLISSASLIGRSESLTVPTDLP